MFSDVLFFIIALCAVIAGIDRVTGNHLGLGRQFEEGFSAMGPLALVMVGITCLSPYMVEVIRRFVNPFFVLFGADESVSGAVFISMDTGVLSLAKELASDQANAFFTTYVLAGMLAPLMTFMIPMGISVVKKEAVPALTIGVIAGLVAIPFGSFAGGVLLRLPVSVIFRNLAPILVVDLAVIIGLLKFTDMTVRVFAVFAAGIRIVITFGLVTVIFQELTGIILLKKLLLSAESFVVIGDIALVLAGAYPLLRIIQVVMKRSIRSLGEALRVSENGVLGMLATLANCMPMIALLPDMSSRGVACNMAFAAGAGWVFGDHLAFCVATHREALAPMIVSKMVTAVLGVAIALLLHRLLLENNRKEYARNET